MKSGPIRARGRNDVVTIPTIRITFVLSILVHAALLWLLLPHLRSLTQASGSQATSLAVDLAPRNDAIASANPRPASPPPVVASPPPAPSVQSHPAPARVPAPRKRPPQPAKPAPASPPVMTQRTPSPAPATVEQPRAAAPAPPAEARPSPPAATPPMPSPPAQDLASYVAAQRAARGEASDSSPAETHAESDTARRDRIVAANLGLNRKPSFGTDEHTAGGLFQITELNYDDAQFYFFGYDKAIGRNARQLIDVRKGSEPDIRIAIVRRMIAIIRDSVTNGDFIWVSQRTGNSVTLSSRPADNAGLEAFILHDIFPEVRQP